MPVSATASHARLGFFDCILDVPRRELLVSGRVVALQPRCFDLLAVLVGQAGQVVTKTDLIAHVWPTQHVTDTVLTSAIARIRRALGAPAAAAVRNIHGIGYRFDGEVRAEPVVGAPDDLALLQTPVAAVPAALPGQTNLHTEHIDVDDFWQRQWQRGLSLARAGSLAHALDVLLTARPHQAPSAEVHVAIAGLLRQRGRMQEAQAEIDAALGGAAGPLAPVQQARLLLERARIVADLYNYTQAYDICASALELLGDQSDSELAAGLLPDVLELQVHGLYMSGATDTARALRHLDSVLTLPRDAAAFVSAQLTRASLLRRQGQMTDAVAQATLGATTAQTHGLVLDQATALLVLSGIRYAQMHPLAGLQAAQQAHGLCGEYADLVLHISICNYVVHGHLELGELAAARVRLDDMQRLADGIESAAARLSLKLSNANLLWRSGRLTEALADALHLQNQPEGAAHLRQYLRERCAMWHLSAQDGGPAQALLASSSAVTSRSTQALLTAGLALLQGEREAAKSHLRRAWLAQGANSNYPLNVIWSLAVLLIEDGDAHGLDACMAELNRLPTGHTAADLVRALHAVKFSGAPLDEAQLQALVQRNCGLVNRHGWLLEPGGIQAWLQGQRQLDELFDLAWF